MMKKKLTITRVNPVAKAMLMLRKPKQVVKAKKGKGSYDRQKINALHYEVKNFEKIRASKKLKQESKRLHGNPYRQERKNKRRFG